MNLLYFKKKKKKRILGYFNLFIFEALIFVTIKLSLSSVFNGNETALKQERVADKNFFIPKNAEVLSDRLLLPHIASAKIPPTLRAQAIIRDF